VRRVDWCRAQRTFDHSSNLVILDRSRSAGASLINQTIAAILQKSATPLTNGMFVQTKLGSHGLARQAVRTPQNDAATLRERPGNTVTTNLPLQIRPFLRAQQQRRDRSASQTCFRHQRSPFKALSAPYNAANLRSR
jgi:hypothetical protein